MRKILIYMVLFFVTSLMAAQVNWAKDYKTGLKLAKEQNKPMLFVISRDTCKYCIILKTTTFKDENVTKVINKDFIAVTSWINENHYVPQKLFTPGLPGIWFLLPSGEPMFQPLMGALGTEEILHYLKQVKSEFEKIKKVESKK